MLVFGVPNPFTKGPYYSAPVGKYVHQSVRPFEGCIYEIVIISGLIVPKYLKNN